MWWAFFVLKIAIYPTTSHGGLGQHVVSKVGKMQREVLHIDVASFFRHGDVTGGWNGTHN